MKATPYWIEGPWRGRLAILPRPRGGDWLADEIGAWKRAGLEVVVSALTDDEVAELDLAGQADEARNQGVELVSLPITDRGVPTDGTAFRAALAQVASRLGEGKYVGVHCRQGVGRSGLLAAALLVLGGVPTKDVWKRVETARGCQVPDTPEQRAWVEQFARSERAAAIAG